MEGRGGEGGRGGGGGKRIGTDIGQRRENWSGEIGGNRSRVQRRDKDKNIACSPFFFCLVDA